VTYLVLDAGAAAYELEPHGVLEELLPVDVTARRSVKVGEVDVLEEHGIAPCGEEEGLGDARDPCEIRRVHEAQDVVDDLRGQLRDEDHGESLGPPARPWGSGWLFRRGLGTGRRWKRLMGQVIQVKAERTWDEWGIMVSVALGSWAGGPGGVSGIRGRT
jgi:hypothetical protein